MPSVALRLVGEGLDQLAHREVALFLQRLEIGERVDVDDGYLFFDLWCLVQGQPASPTDRQYHVDRFEQRRLTHRFGHVAIHARVQTQLAITLHGIAVKPMMG